MPITPRSVSARRLVPLTIVLTAAVWMVGGCGGPSLTAASSCRDFMNASAQDQDEAVNRIATDEHAPNATSPLGRPNIAYLCAGDPSMTLGSAISHSN